MKLYEFIEQHEEELLDLPQMPEREDYEYCRFVGSYSDPYGYVEESGFCAEEYDYDMLRWEIESEKVRSEYVFRDSDLCLIDIDGNEITDWDEIRKRLEYDVVKVDGFDVWVA